MNPRSFLAWLSFAALMAAAGASAAADEVVNGVRILERTHYSRVMGEMRHYRVFLPPDYDQSDRRYPVVYYFHGWSQRYYGSRPGGKQYEQGDDNGGDNFANFVARHPVIVVKWDGYNPREFGEDYLRPYNIGPVETHRQFPHYFPELVAHIDNGFRTMPDREHRGVTGLSMGGFMAYWVGGKYPDLIGSVSNFMGSTEFDIGPRDFPVEYNHADMTANYKGRPVRHHMGTQDFIRGYHARVNRTWDYVLDHYEHQTYESDHGSAGLGDMLDFHMKAFANPMPLPAVFDHIDVYPAFEVGGYQVSSDRCRPGFNLLENASRDGFRSSVRRWLPDGPVMDWVRLTVTTDSIYVPGKTYMVTDLDLTHARSSADVVKAGADGRIRWTTDGALRQVGITPEDSGRPILSLAGTEWSDKPWLEAGVGTGLILKVVNSGVNTASGVRARVSPHGASGLVEVKDGEVSLGEVPPGGAATSARPIRVLVTKDVADRVRLDLLLTDGDGGRWASDFTLPVKLPAREVSKFIVADGAAFTVLEHGNQLNRKTLGRGNGDGVANPGETIVILVSRNDTLRMTEATTNDPYLNRNGMAGRFTDNWGSFDHVGGSNRVSELMVASDCPSGRKIPLHCYYLVPDYPEHFPGVARVTITVSGSDTVPPELDFVKITSDGRLLARLRDGGRIESVEADLNNSVSPDSTYHLTLLDDGRGPDRTAGDFVFSADWRPLRHEPGHYLVKLVAVDQSGNRALLEAVARYE